MFTAQASLASLSKGIGNQSPGRCVTCKEMNKMQAGPLKEAVCPLQVCIHCLAALQASDDKRDVSWRTYSAWFYVNVTNTGVTERRDLN